MRSRSLFIAYKEAPWVETKPGFRYKPIVINNLGAALSELAMGFTSTPHEHADEQLNFLLAGTVELSIRDERGDRTETVTAGMAFALEPHVLHGVRALEDSVMIEAWTPADRHRKVAITMPES